MLPNKLQSCQPTFLFKCEKLEQTSETLTYLTLPSKADLSQYYLSTSSSTQLLSHTLAHNNMEWLENQLEYVKQNAKRFHLEQNSQKNIQNYNQNLIEVSDKISLTLQKINQQRRIIQTKLIKYFLLKSKETNKKNIKKSNLFKYKQLLLNIRQLYRKTNQNQQEINRLRQRLKTSGLFLVPSLVQKSIINLAYQAISLKNKRVIINNKSNLRLIAQFFMQNEQIQNKLIGNHQIQQQKLYLKFKIYVLLKTYIDTRQHNGQLDEACQDKITSYYQINLCRITETQLLKVRSLVQCNKKVYQYFNYQSIFYLQQMLKQIMKFIHRVNNYQTLLSEKFIQQILKANKKQKNLQNIIAPNNLFESLQNLDQINIQIISYIIQVIEDRQNLFKLYQKQLNFSFKINEIKKYVLLQCIKCLLIPLFKLIIGVNSLIYKDQKQKHYQNTRIIQKYFATLNLLIGQQYKLKQHRFKSIIQQSLKNIKIVLQNQNKQQSSDTQIYKLNNKKQINKKQLKISKTGTNLSIRYWIMQYNEHFGQLYLYLVNKFANLIKININNERDWHPLSIQNFIGIWISLISQKISQFKPQSNNQIKSIKFLQNQVNSIIYKKQQIQKQINILHELATNQLLNKSKNKKIINQQQIQQFYGKILQLNLRTNNYNKLMDICKIIKVQEQIKKMNQQLYLQTFKKIKI